MNVKSLLQYLLVFTFLLQCQTLKRRKYYIKSPSLKKCRSSEECTNVANCPSSEISKLIASENNERISKRVAKSVLKRICGFDLQLQIKVCCPRLGRMSYIGGCKGYNHENMTKVLPVNECGMNSPQAGANIRGGNEMKHHKNPWMAKIEVGYDNAEGVTMNGYCAGTLISNRFILAAAHCFAKIPASNVSAMAILGSSDSGLLDGYESDEEQEDSSQSGDENNEADHFEDHDNEIVPGPAERQIFKIDKIIIHPNFKSSKLQNDIALLLLDSDAALTEAVRPICLPIGRQSCKNLVDEQLTVPGWGYKSNQAGEKIDVIREDSVKYVLRSSCSKQYRSSNGISSTQLCAVGSKTADACQSDGSPIQLQVWRNDTLKQNKITVQYGTASFGATRHSRRSKNIPDVYTRIVSYLPWIIDTMMENTSPDNFLNQTDIWY